MTDRPPPSTISYILATFLIAACLGYYIGQATSIGLFTPTPKPSSSSHKTSKEKPKGAGAPSKASWPNSYDVTVHPDSSDEELMTRLRGKDGGGGRKQVKDSEEEDDEEDESVSGDDDGEEEKESMPESGEIWTYDSNKEECKLVLVVRTDLGMGKGKIAAQCAHAALACYKRLSTSPTTSPTPNRTTTHPLLTRWEAAGQPKIAVQVPSLSEMQFLEAQATSLGLCARVIHDAGRTQVASGSATVLGVGPGPRSVVDRVTGGLKLL
ncbi:peptidyl-tRNA hydrolase PTH2-domain-containing protein [Usnea florida]